MKPKSTHIASWGLFLFGPFIFDSIFLAAQITNKIKYEILK